MRHSSHVDELHVRTTHALQERRDGQASMHEGNAVILPRHGGPSRETECCRECNIFIRVALYTLHTVDVIHVSSEIVRERCGDRLPLRPVVNDEERDVDIVAFRARDGLQQIAHLAAQFELCGQRACHLDLSTLV